MIDRARRLLRSADRWTTDHSLTRVLRRAIEGFLAHEGLQYAGTMAYFAVLSIFQLLVLAVVIGSFVLGEGAARDFVIEQVHAGTPLDAETVRGSSTAPSRRAAASPSSLRIAGVGRARHLLGAVQRHRAGFRGVTAPLVPHGQAARVAPDAADRRARGGLARHRHRDGHPPVGGQRAGRRPSRRRGGGLGHRPAGPDGPHLLRLLVHLPHRAELPGRLAGGPSGRDRGNGAVDGAALRLHLVCHERRALRHGLRPARTGVTLLVFLYFASVVVLLGAEIARASALDDEIGIIAKADPRLLPVPVDAPRPAPPLARRGVPGGQAGRFARSSS